MISNTRTNMKNAIIVAAALMFGSVMTGCGSSGEIKGPEPKATASVSSSNSEQPAVNTTTRQNDGEADDKRATNSSAAVNTNVSRARSGDRDDIRSANRSGNANRAPSRGDADDRGGKDSDGDDDDQ